MVQVLGLLCETDLKLHRPYCCVIYIILLHGSDIKAYPKDPRTRKPGF